MDVSGLSANPSNIRAAKLSADVQFSMQRKAHDVAKDQMAQLVESMDVPAGLTYTPNGPSSGDQRRFIADL